MNETSSHVQDNFELNSRGTQGSKDELEFPSDEDELDVNTQGHEDILKKSSVSFQFQSFENPKISLQTGSYKHSSEEDLTNSNTQPRARRRYSLERDVCFGVATAQNMQGSKMEDAYKAVPFSDIVAQSIPKLPGDSKNDQISDTNRPEKKRKTTHSNEHTLSLSPKIVNTHSDVTNYAFFAVYDGKVSSFFISSQNKDTEVLKLLNLQEAVFMIILSIILYLNQIPRKPFVKDF